MAKSEKRELSIAMKLIDEFSPATGKMLRGIKKFGGGAVKVFGGVVKRVFNLKTAIVGLATSVIGLGTIQAFGNAADNLSKLADATGDNVANLSELQAAFELSNVPADAFSQILKGLLNQSREAQRGNLVLADSFAAVGISVDDLKSLAPAQLFEQVAAGLEQFNSKQEKAAALGKLLPENFLRLLPVLGNGIRAFQNSIIEARKAGATVTAQQAATSAALNNSLGKLKISIGGVSRALIEEFGPEAVAVLDLVASAITENREGIVDFITVIGSGIVKASDLAITGLIGLIATIESIPGVNLLGDDTEEQVLALERRLDTLRGSGAFGKDGPAAAQIQLLRGDEIAKLEAQIVALRQKTAGNLTDELRAFREKLTSELSQAAADVRSAAGAPVVGDEAATVLGLPTLAEVKRINAELAQERSAADFTSVFQTPDNKPLDDFKRSADEAIGSVDELRLLVAEKPLVAFDGDFFDGFESSAKRGIAEFTNFSSIGAQAGSVLMNGLDGIGNALGNIISRTQSSREAWTQLGTSTIAMLGRLFAKLVAVKAVSNLFGGSVALEDGGVVQGTMGRPVKAQAFAQGGIATGPTLALFGEGRSAEAFVPLPDGKTIPVTMNGGGGGGGTTVNFNINAVDGQSVKRMLIDEAGTITSIVQSAASGGDVPFRQAMARAAG